MPHTSRLNFVAVLLAALMTISIPASAQLIPDRELAEGALRCETFYTHYYESLRFSNPSALASGPLTKLSDAIRLARIIAEAFVGEKEAKLIYGANLEKRILEFVDAAAHDWTKFANKMSAECSSLFRDNDSEVRSVRIKAYAKEKGIEDLPFSK